MDDLMEALTTVPQGPLVMFAVGGAVMAVGSLAYGWWQERIQQKMGKQVVDLGKRLYSMQAIRASMGRLIKETVDELVIKDQMTQDDADKVCEALAFKICAWELHPKPKPCLPPDPVLVKTTIRARLSNGSGIRICPFPDLSFPKPKGMREELLAILQGK